MSTIDALLEVTVDKFTFRVKPDLLYTADGVWVEWNQGRRTARVGITDFRQQTSGDVAFVELPEIGWTVAVGADLAEIETIKTDFALPSPLAGTVSAANPELAGRPELINQDPYGAGWLVELKPQVWPVAGLLSAQAYLEIMTTQALAEAQK